jgi:hypothetical protein
MLIRRATLDAIRDGRVTLQFRRWSRPRVRVGTKLRTAVGLVEVVAIEAVEAEQVSDADVGAAGAAGRDQLLSDRRGRGGDPLFRIELRFAGPDPRVALREDAALSTEELRSVRDRLAAIDARSQHGPWTWAVLELIDRHPATRAADLAALRGRERLPFKADVRRLKELGLTESLAVGYRISPRGRAVLASRGP